MPAEYCRGSKDLVLKDTEGYISSIATEETGCGLQNPWIITALPGQRINLTLYDFAMATQNESATPRRISYPVYCQQYARVEETDAARATLVCGGEGRVRNVYLSVTNRVEVHVMNRRVHGKPQYFLIKYQGEFIIQLQFSNSRPLACHRLNIAHVPHFSVWQFNSIFQASSGARIPLTGIHLELF